MQRALSKMDTLEKVGTGAAVSWSRGFSRGLCSVTLGLGSLECRLSAGHIPCLSLLSLEQAELCQPLAESSHMFGFSSTGLHGAAVVLQVMVNVQGASQLLSHF